MRSTIITLICLLLSSCVTWTEQTRNEVLLPAVTAAWGTPEAGVMSDILWGVDNATQAGELQDASTVLEHVDRMSSAIAQGDRFALATIPWPMLRMYAERGIDARVSSGSMVEQSAIFLRRRLTSFDEAFRKLTDPAYVATRTPLRRTGPVTVPTTQGPATLVVVAQQR